MYHTILPYAGSTLDHSPSLPENGTRNTALMISVSAEGLALHSGYPDHPISWNQARATSSSAASYSLEIALIKGPW